MILLFGDARASSCAASTPFSRGIPMSMTMMSGCRLAPWLTASWPFEASPRIANPSRSKRARRPWRTMLWSSAMSTLVGIGVGLGWQRYGDRERRAKSRRRRDVERAPQHFEAAADPDQTQSTVLRSVFERPRQPASVVVHEAQHTTADAIELD